MPRTLSPISTLSEFLRPRSHEIMDRVRDRFDQSAYRSVRHVHCVYARGMLTLRGRVSSFYLKQIAQELAGSVVGVTAVDNRIEVDGQARREIGFEPPPIGRRKAAS